MPSEENLSKFCWADIISFNNWLQLNLKLIYVKAPGNVYNMPYSEQKFDAAFAHNCYMRPNRGQISQAPRKIA